MSKEHFYNQIASDVDLEELLAQVYFDDEMIAVISQEEGIDKAVLELWPRTDGKNWEVNFKQFMNAMERAYKRLKSMKKIEDQPVLDRDKEYKKHPNRKDWIDVYAPDGRGARLDKDGNFIHFLEP